MEYITAEHLEKYENILQKIDSEYQICQQLENQIKRENDKIVAANIALQENIIKQKLFKVNVRIFDTVFELVDHFDSVPKQASELLGCKHCKFYLVEVYVSPVFQDKLVTQKWLLNVKVRSSNKVVSQTLNLKNEAFTYPLNAIIPFDGSERSCWVETTLALASRDFWTSIVLETVFTDVSYHFKINKEVASPSADEIESIVNTCECYCRGNDILQRLKVPEVKEYCFSFTSDVIDFLKNFIINCYHRVDVELFSSLEKAKFLNLDIKTDHTSKNRIVVNLNPDESTLRIKAEVGLLYEIKKYFIEAANNKQLVFKKTAVTMFNVGNFLRYEIRFLYSLIFRECHP